MSHMPETVRKRILELCARNEKVIILPRDGKPARVHRYDKYEKMKKLPHDHKPWTLRRRKAEPVPDPLGAVEGTILGPLTRRHMYEELE